jgi:hypothetical protein
MSKYLLRLAAFLTVALSFTVPVFATQDAREATFPSTMDKLFQGSEHQEIPWKVTFASPRLMYQQVYLVQARTRIDPVVLKRVSSTSALHFVLKVQCEDGKWAKGGEYKDFKIPPDLGRDREIEYATVVYLRPGTYTLNLAVFDYETGKSSLTRETVHIPKMGDDPFPELNTYLAPVEFPEDFPQQEVGNDRADDGELFPASRERDPIPVANPRPAVIDIVLDITKRPKPEVPDFIDRFGRPRRRPTPISANPIPSYDLELGRLLQVGNLLARLAPQTGCVRVGAVDALRMKTVLDRTEQKKMDWPRFEEQMGKFNQDTVEVGVLTNKKGPAQFMRRYLDELSADAPSCGAGAGHYIIVVSHEVPFPAKDEKLPEVDRERAHFYYLFSQASGGMGDDLNDLLKPVKPERISFNSPRDFRKALARIVADLKAGK